MYDVLSAEVDKFTWENQDFLPVFAAGNYGELSQKFLTTVTSPALAKNCLAVGATLTADQALRTTRKERVDTYEIEVEAAVDGGGTETRRYCATNAITRNILQRINMVPEVCTLTQNIDMSYFPSRCTNQQQSILYTYLSDK